jgi:adenine-specific DNA-methyltransferase
MPQLRTDIRSLYKHEDIRPEAIIDNLYELHEHKSESAKLQLDLFGDLQDSEEDELERLAGYYKHSDNWQNRLIQGDSLLVMNSLLNREGMKGQVQCIYMDPPYGTELALDTLEALGRCSFVTDDTVIMLETSLDSDISGLEDFGLEIYREKDYRTNRHLFIRKIREME